MKESLKKDFENLLSFQSKEEELDFQADLLAMQFLGLVDQEMERNNISKKALAEKIGTSASFITQLFRGDKRPNWSMLAKMAQTLDIQFKVMTDEMIHTKIDESNKGYDTKSVYTQKPLRLKKQKSNPSLFLAEEPPGKDDY